MLPQDVLSRISGVKEFLLHEKDVVFAYLFGSLSRKRQTPLSDVDIALYLDDPRNVAERKLDLFVGLADILGTSEIDLVILNEAPLSLAGRILQSRKVLVDKDPFRRHRYESVTLRTFFDFCVKERTILSLRFGIG